MQRIFKSSKVKFTVLLVSLVCVFYGMGFQNCSAEGVDPNSFKFRLTLPDNQEPNIRSYFFLNVQKGEVENLEINVDNVSAQPIEFDVLACNAFSDPAGGILYEQQIDSEYSSFIDDTYKLEKNITVQNKLTVPAQSTGKIPVTVKVPDKDSGLLIGGVKFIAKIAKAGDTAASGKNAANFQINLQTAVVIPIKLKYPNPETTNYDKAENYIGNAKFDEAQKNINIEIINPSEDILRDFVVKYDVKDASGKVLFQSQKTLVQLAPKTKIKFSDKWAQNVQLEPGKYSINTIVTKDTKELVKTSEFEITKKQVQAVQEKEKEIQSVGKVTNEIPIYVWIIIGLLAFLLIAVVVVGLIILLKNKKHGDYKTQQIKNDTVKSGDENFQEESMSSQEKNDDSSGDDDEKE